MSPLAIDLFCGLGGWTEGLLAEGYEVIGFDIEQHVYGEHHYPAQLVLQDVRTLHGRQFKDAALIVASPPCQAYSYRAMPWKRAKALPPPSNELFEACFRIQREASEAAGHHVPMVVENVKGAQPWVGRSRWNFGSFHLWGDVPALMPMIVKHKIPGFRFDGSGRSFQTAAVEHTGVKAPGLNWSDRTKHGQDFTRVAGNQAIKNGGGSWFKLAHNTTSGRAQNPDGRLWKRDPMASAGSGSAKRKAAAAMIADGSTNFHHHNADGTKLHASGRAWFDLGAALYPSGSARRKAASAMMAKIPLPLARHIAAIWHPSRAQIAGGA